MGSGASKSVRPGGGLSPTSRRKKAADEAEERDPYAHRFSSSAKSRASTHTRHPRSKLFSERVPEGLATYVADDVRDALGVVDLLEQRAVAAGVDVDTTLTSRLASLRKVLLDTGVKDMSFRVDHDALDDETSRWLAERTGVSSRRRS